MLLNILSKLDDARAKALQKDVVALYAQEKTPGQILITGSHLLEERHKRLRAIERRQRRREQKCSMDNSDTTDVKSERPTFADPLICAPTRAQGLRH